MIKRLQPFPTWLGYVLSVPLVGLTTVCLYNIQRFLALHTHADYIRPYGIGYIVPISLITAIAGRRCGFATLLLSLAALDYFLLYPYDTWHAADARSVTEMILLFLVGLLVIAGIDAMRKNAQILAEAHAQTAREALLHRIGEKLRDSGDTDDIQSTVARELGETLHADRCYFGLYDLGQDFASGGLNWEQPGFSAYLDEDRLETFRLEMEALYATHGTIVVNDVQFGPFSPETAVLLQQMHQRALISVPIYSEGQLAAVLAVVMAEEPREWTEMEVAMVESVSTQTLTTVQAARTRMRERRIASVLQEALLPQKPDKIPGLDVAPFYKPALDEASVGGDFYDVFTVSEEAFALVVGDVSGKGLNAAVQVGVVRNMLRCLLYQETTVAEAVTQLNTMLACHNLLAGFTTLFVGLYHNRQMRFTYVSCGHEPGLLCRAGGGPVEELEATGPVLGAIPGIQYSENTIALESGDTLAIYTDGLTDAGPSFTSFLGVPGLSELLMKRHGLTSASAIAAHLVQGVELYAGGSLRDDACLLVAVA